MKRFTIIDAHTHIAASQASLAAAISDKFGVQPELIKGKNGVFEVVADETLLFSKKSAGRFPENEEILKLLGK